MNSTEGLVFILMNSTEGLVFNSIHENEYSFAHWAPEPVFVSDKS